MAIVVGANNKPADYLNAAAAAAKDGGFVSQRDARDACEWGRGKRTFRFPLPAKQAAEAFSAAGGIPRSEAAASFVLALRGDQKGGESFLRCHYAACVALLGRHEALIRAATEGGAIPPVEERHGPYKGSAY